MRVLLGAEDTGNETPVVRFQKASTGFSCRKAEKRWTDEQIKLDVTTKRVYNKAMDFEWDADKEALNLRKHGVRFSVAARVLLDPYRIEAYDGREDYGEDRWATIGYADPALLYVVYTVRHDETIRLISARKANEQERKQYRQAHP